MLTSLRLSSVRHALIVVLMILSALVAFERVQAIVNAVQHGLEIEHDAPRFDLTAAVEAHHHDHDHDHEPVVSGHGDGDGDAPSDADEKDRAPAPHHHHVEGVQVAALPAPVTVSAAMSRSQARFAYADLGSPRSRIFGLDRPPKALSDRA